MLPLMKQSDLGQEISEESIDVQDARSRVSTWPIVEAAVSNFHLEFLYLIFIFLCILAEYQYFFVFFKSKLIWRSLSCVILEIGLRLKYRLTPINSR